MDCLGILQTTSGRQFVASIVIRMTDPAVEGSYKERRSDIMEAFAVRMSLLLDIVSFIHLDPGRWKHSSRKEFPEFRELYLEPLFCDI